ncbi:hypothetical protein Taro_022375 [Colocasia esculenta]|uniref:Uncharacterized protein n=1 Tax=Colocasia esculenta TaxID=4460 RepID=A0A843UU95_COLES|nr:hypothetical protein [Colocasia esculenta]
MVDVHIDGRQKHVNCNPWPPTQSRRHPPGRQPTVDVQRTEHQHRPITKPEYYIKDSRRSRLGSDVNLIATTPQ